MCFIYNIDLFRILLINSVTFFVGIIVNKQIILTTLVMDKIYFYLLFLLILRYASCLFCSSICKINACSGVTKNDCNNQCSSNWTPISPTCVVDPNLYALIDTSADLGGFISFSPDPGISTCSSYSFTGLYGINDEVIVDLVDGITIPYY